MAYKNIVFVKLERRLLNDYRWFQMSDHAQLLYIKLILLAAETCNKIPKGGYEKQQIGSRIQQSGFENRQFDTILYEAVRSKLEPGEFIGALKEIKNNFPKFKSNRYFYYFEEFEHKTNWLPSQQSLSNRSAISQHSVEVDKEVDKEKKKRKRPQLSDSEFIETLKTDPIYKHIDFEFEFKKMDKWFLANPNRQRTRRFIVNWINKIEKPVEIRKESKFKPADPSCNVCSGTGWAYIEAKSANEICKCRIKQSL